LEQNKVFTKGVCGISPAWIFIEGKSLNMFLPARMQSAQVRVSPATKLGPLCCLLLAVSIARGQGSQSAIRGTLSDNGTPITEASVFLQSFDDAACARLFTTGPIDRKAADKLKSCSHDLGTVSPDSNGHYEFTIPNAGWYAVHFLWNIGKKPSQSVFIQGQWTVAYAGHKDSTGRYDTMAQDAPFYFSAKEDVTRNFDLPVPEPPKPLRERLSLATKDWGVVLDLPGFVVKSIGTKPDGRLYMIAENSNTKVVVSLALEGIKPGTRASSCRESLEKRTKIKELKIKDIRFSRSGDSDVLRYFVSKFRGEHINQESLFACQVYDNTHIDLHISKVDYTAVDEPLFADVLKSMHLDKV